MAQLLLEHNAEIEVRDKSNRTPLHYAASGNSIEVAQLLLKHNAKMEVRDESNRTPFHDNASSSNREVAQN